MGLWSTLGIGKSAIQASQLAMEITSHNIANAGTEGYARQRPLLRANRPWEAGGGLILGTGVDVGAIWGLVDRQLEERMRLAAGQAGDLTMRHTYLARVESIFNELGGEDVSSALVEFFNAIEDLQPTPQDMALRRVLVQRATNLANAFTRTRGRLDQVRLEVDAKVVTAVDQVNSLLREVGALNGEIVQREMGGQAGPANDLRHQRALRLEDLARLIGTRTIETSNGSVNVFLGNEMLVQDQRVNELAVQIDTDRGLKRSVVVFADNESPVRLRGGELAGLVASRDDVLGGLVDDLDRLAGGIIWEVNRVHSEGQGLTPLGAVTAGEAVIDPDAVLTAAGLHFTPLHGQFNVTVLQRDTGVGTTTTIDVDLDGLDGNDATLTGVAAALDAVTGIRAYVDSRHRLVVEAESDQTAFAFSDDSSGLLAAVGVNTLFGGWDSRTFAVADTVAADPSLVAASRSGDAADASNLTAMLEIRSGALADLDGLAPSEFLETSAATLAVQTASADDAALAADIFLSALHAEREAHSGVSLDEEAMDLIRFEQTFQAAARLIATVHELMQMILDM